MNGEEILALPMEETDVDASTIRDYLKKLLSAIWAEGESFSGKRPFGNSGWQRDLELALVRGGAVTGKLDNDGYLDDIDGPAAQKAIVDAIDAL